MTSIRNKSLPAHAKEVFGIPVTNLSPVTPEVSVPDVHELLERERHLPDVRRAGRECATPGCSTKIYLSSLGPTCRQCARRAVNTSSHQRDSGAFAHTSGGAS